MVGKDVSPEGTTALAEPTFFFETKAKNRKHNLALRLSAKRLPEESRSSG